MAIDLALERHIKAFGSTVQVDGQYTTKVLLKRPGRQLSQQAVEYHQEGRALPDSGIATGSMLRQVSTDEHHLVIGVSKQTVNDRVVSLLLLLLECNGVATIQRPATTTDPNTGKQSVQWDTVADNVKVFHEYVTSGLKASEPGLLPNAVLRVYMQATVDVQLMDRIGIEGKNYMVESVDPVKCPGLYVVQVSYDRRA